MKARIKRTRPGSILLLTLCVLFSGHFSEALHAQDSLSTVRRSGRDHGYEAIEGFELVQPVPDRVPFGEGEYLLFAIQYGLLYAGDATLEGAREKAYRNIEKITFEDHNNQGANCLRCRRTIGA